MTEESFLEVINDLSDECAYSGVMITPDIRSSSPSTIQTPGCISINGILIEDLVPGYHHNGYIDRELMRTALFTALDNISCNADNSRGDGLP